VCVCVCVFLRVRVCMHAFAYLMICKEVNVIWSSLVNCVLIIAHCTGVSLHEQPDAGQTFFQG